MVKLPYRELMEKAERLREQAKELENQAYSTAAQCRHVWDYPEGLYKPDYEEGYTIPERHYGGIDRDPAVYVPAKTTKKWVRTCTVCGVDQHTLKTKQVCGTNGLKKEVPDFDPYKGKT